METDYAIIDYLNTLWKHELLSIPKYLGISKSTFYRKLSVLRKNGLREAYVINTVCSKLKIVNVFLSINACLRNNKIYNTLLNKLGERILGPLTIIHTFSPSRSLILSYIARGDIVEKTIDLVYEYSRYLYDVIDALILDQYEVPVIMYARDIILDPLLGVDMCSTSSIELDIYDYYIIDGLLHGISSIRDISKTYIIPESLLRYHYRSHVRELIMRKVYYIEYSPNVLMQFVLSNKEALYRLLNEFYGLGVIKCINKIMYSIGTDMFQAIVLLSTNNLPLLINKLYSALDTYEDIYDVRLLPVYVEVLAREGTMI